MDDNNLPMYAMIFGYGMIILFMCLFFWMVAGDGVKAYFVCSDDTDFSTTSNVEKGYVKCCKNIIDDNHNIIDSVCETKKLRE